MYQHRVIDGRIYRVVKLEAADSRAAREHISAKPPTPHSEAKRHRQQVGDFVTGPNHELYGHGIA